MRNGYHHLSAVEFEGTVYLAVDGIGKDRYVNTLILATLKVYEYIRSLFRRNLIYWFDDIGSSRDNRLFCIVFYDTPPRDDGVLRISPR